MTTFNTATLFTSVAVCSVLVAGCGGAQSRLASYMHRGQDYYSQGDFAKASIEFRNALQIAPKDPLAQVMEGRAAEHLGKLPEALSLYQAVVDAPVENLEARRSLGRMLIQHGQPQRGLDVLAPAIAKHPDDVDLLVWRAAGKASLKNVDGARADADRALQLAPDNADAISVRAGLYQQAGDLPSAAHLLEDAVRRLPTNVDLREVLVNVDSLAGEPGKAEEQLNALTKIAPTQTRYRTELATLYVHQNKLDEAQRVLEDTVRAVPHDDTAKVTLAQFLYARRSPQQGEEAFRKFVAQEPTNSGLRLGFASLLQRSGKIKEALDEYAEVIRREDTEPKGLIARDQVANIALAQGKADEARADLDVVLKKNPRDIDALTLRGRMSLARHDNAGAITDFRAVVRDQPRDINVRRLLAEALLADGEPALAEETLRSAMDTAPDDAALRVQLGDLLVQTRRVDLAVPLLEETVRKAPKDLFARQSLARAYLAKRDFANARIAAEALKTLKPDAATGWYIAGLAAQGENKPDEAQKEYEQGLLVQPNAFDVITSLARLEAARGNVAQAVATAQKAMQLDPKSAAPANLVAELQLGTGQLNPAVETLNRAISLAPTWWVPYRNLALAKYALKDVPGAIAAYQASIKAAPDQRQPVSELVLLYEERGRFDDAIACYDTWFRQHPKDQYIANNLAMLLVNNKTDRASLDRARDLAAPFANTSDGNLLDTNGWVHFKRAEYSDALSVLQRAAERQPDSREIRYHLGMAELLTGQKDRARTDLETALAGSAKFSGADEARTVLASLKGQNG